ncbi:conserved hypothetical protein [Vibrio phage 277E43-1]|nr:conserved hypothetical protein [Vibrio phage 277E43-1]
MIELIKLTKKERIDVSLKCESFFLQSKKVGKFEPLYKELVKYTSRKNAKELWMFITAACRAVRYDLIGSKFPLSKPNYISANKRFKLKVSHTRSKEMLCDLEKADMITLYKGFKDEDWSMTSCFVMTDKLLSMIPVEKAKRYAVKRSPEEFVKIKDYTSQKFIEDYKGYSGITLYRKQMDKFNNFLEDKTITIGGIEHKVCYIRIFADNLDGAGRFYTTNGFINYQSHLRETMLIEGEEVTEIDLANLHPRLCAMLEGIKVEDDWEPYSIDSSLFPDMCSTGYVQLRKLCKKALMAVLYSDTKDKAVKSLFFTFNKSKHEDFKLLPISSKKDCENIIDSLVKRNASISKHFFVEGGWKKLQNLDSKICAYIVNRFTNLKEVCLPYHDSWCVVKKNGNLLVEVMKEAWVDLFGTTMNFKYNVEF